MSNWFQVLPSLLLHLSKKKISDTVNEVCVGCGGIDLCRCRHCRRPEEIEAGGGGGTAVIRMGNTPPPLGALCHAGPRCGMARRLELMLSRSRPQVHSLILQ